MRGIARCHIVLPLPSPPNNTDDDLINVVDRRRDVNVVAIVVVVDVPTPSLQCHSPPHDSKGRNDAQIVVEGCRPTTRIKDRVAVASRDDRDGAAVVIVVRIMKPPGRNTRRR